MKHVLVILFMLPWFALAQSYVRPNVSVSAYFVKANVINDTLKIESEKPINMVEIIIDSSRTIRHKVIGYSHEIPLQSIPNGRYVLNVNADRLFILYWLIVK